MIGAEVQDHSDRQGQHVTCDSWPLGTEIRNLFLLFTECTLFGPQELALAQKGGVQPVRRVRGTNAWSILGIEATSSENKTVLCQLLAQSEQQHPQQGK